MLICQRYFSSVHGILVQLNSLSAHFLDTMDWRPIINIVKVKSFFFAQVMRFNGVFFSMRCFKYFCPLFFLVLTDYFLEKMFSAKLYYSILKFLKKYGVYELYVAFFSVMI